VNESVLWSYMNKISIIWWYTSWLNLLFYNWNIAVLTWNNLCANVNLLDTILWLVKYRSQFDNTSGAKVYFWFGILVSMLIILTKSPTCFFKIKLCSLPLFSRCLQNKRKRMHIYSKNHSQMPQISHPKVSKRQSLIEQMFFFS